MSAEKFHKENGNFGNWMKFAEAYADQEKEAYYKVELEKVSDEELYKSAKKYLDTEFVGDSEGSKILSFNHFTKCTTIKELAEIFARWQKKWLLNKLKQ